MNGFFVKKSINDLLTSENINFTEPKTLTIKDDLVTLINI